MTAGPQSKKWRWNGQRKPQCGSCDDAFRSWKKIEPVALSLAVCHRERETSMTSEELALVDAIHADPRSDSPRLAYADWLENHGAADYAEFIRLQCDQPYVAICTRDEPGVSTSHKFPWADEAARHRLKQLISL